MPPELALLSHPASRCMFDPSAHPRPETRPLAPLSLIVHSGQRWIQASDRARPLLSRLSVHHPVMFVEPPMHAAVDHPLMQLSEPHPQVIRAVPLLPLRTAQEADAQRALTAWLLGTLLPAQAAPDRVSPSNSNGAHVWNGASHPQTPSPITLHPPSHTPSHTPSSSDIDSLVVGLPDADWDGEAASGHETALRIGRSLAQRFAAPLQWFGTPLEAPVLIGRFGCMGTVYDRACAMLHPDRWHPEFVERDRGLLRQADLVFFNGEPAVNSARAAHLRNGSAQDRESLVAQAVRAAWDAKAALIHSRLTDTFAGRRKRPLPVGFLAASVQAFGLQ